MRATTAPKLANQKLAPDLVFAGDRRLELRRERCSRGPDLRERRVGRARVSLPFGGTVIGVERIGIALAEREHQAHVRFGRRVEGRRRPA